MHETRARGEPAAARLLAFGLIGVSLSLLTALALVRGEHPSTPRTSERKEPTPLTPRKLAAEADAQQRSPKREPTKAAASVPFLAPSTRATAPPDASICPLPGTAAVSGAVLDATGGVVAGAAVRASGASSALVQTSLTDSEGRFRFCTAPGFVDIQTRAPDYTRADERVLAPAHDLRFTLVPASTIVGTVVHDETGHAAGGALVSARAEAFERPVQTAEADATGHFELTGVASGSYELVAVTADGRSSQRRLWVDVADRVDTTLRLRRATHLQARLELDERPCRQGVVELSGPVNVIRHSETDGSVFVDGLLPGQYLASFACSRAREPTAEGEGRAPGLAHPVVGGDEFIDVAREPVTRVWRLTSPPPQAAAAPPASGRVLVSFSNADQPSADANAIVLHRLTRTSHRGEWQAGLLVFDGLELGDYDVYLERCPDVHTAVTLQSAGATLEVALTLPRAATIAGRVLDERGQPLPDTWVQAYNTEYPSSELGPAGKPELTDVDGSFLLRGLFATAYDLVAIGAVGMARTEGVAGGSRDVTLRLLTAPQPSAR